MQYNKGYDNAGMQSAAGSAVVVTAPAQMTMQVGGKVDDHLGLAIFATFCCFWPSGAFAIFKAIEARSAIDRGDLAGARSASQTSRVISMVTIGVGVGLFVLLAIILGVYFGLYYNAITDIVHSSNNFVHSSNTNFNKLFHVPVIHTNLNPFIHNN